MDLKIIGNRVVLPKASRLHVISSVPSSSSLVVYTSAMTGGVEVWLVNTSVCLEFKHVSTSLGLSITSGHRSSCIPGRRCQASI
jgi:hypothetical protein